MPTLAEGYLPWPGGYLPWLGGYLPDLDTQPGYGQTDARENSTFPILRMWTVIAGKIRPIFCNLGKSKTVNLRNRFQRNWEAKVTHTHTQGRKEDMTRLTQICSAYKRPIKKFNNYKPVPLFKQTYAARLNDSVASKDVSTKSKSNNK